MKTALLLATLSITALLGSCSTTPLTPEERAAWRRRAAISGGLAKIINSPPVTRVQQPTYQYSTPTYSRPVQQNRTPSNSLQNNQYYQQLQMQILYNQLQNNSGYGN